MGKQKFKKQPQLQRYSEFSSHELSHKIEEHFELPCIDISNSDFDELSILLHEISKRKLRSSFLFVKNSSNQHFPIFSATIGWKLFYMETVLDGNVDWNLPMSINNIQTIYSS